MKQNLVKIPLFAQMEILLEEKKYFKLLGAFDLLSTLFDLETFQKKDVLFHAGDVGEKLYVVCEGCVRISSTDTPDGKELTLNMLTKNEVFGEIALLEETTRTAKASAFENSMVLSITREKFSSLLEVFPVFEEIIQPLLTERTANTLKLVPLFSKLDKSVRNLVGHLCRFTSFFSGMTIFEEGSISEGFFILIEGTVSVTSMKGKGSGDGGASETARGAVQLGIMEKGDVLGEIGLLARTTRTATLTAMEPCRMLYMSDQNFASLLSIAPELLDPLISLGKSRRSNSINILGNDVTNRIPPDIDVDIHDKLHIYSLMRKSKDPLDAPEEKTDDDYRLLQLESHRLDVELNNVLTCTKLLQQMMRQKKKECILPPYVTPFAAPLPIRNHRRYSWPAIDSMDEMIVLKQIMQSASAVSEKYRKNSQINAERCPRDLLDLQEGENNVREEQKVVSNVLDDNAVKRAERLTLPLHMYSPAAFEAELNSGNEDVDERVHRLTN